MNGTLNYTRSNKKLPSTHKKEIDKATNIVLVILWVGAAALITFMMFRWQKGGSLSHSWGNAFGKELLIDDVLLSTGDLELDKNTSLINITLNQSSANTDRFTELEARRSDASKNVIYNNILKQKIQKAKKEPSDGFVIKPLPE